MISYLATLWGVTIILGGLFVNDPIIKGRPYTEWLERARKAWSNSLQDTEAQDAIRQAGPQGYPTILAYLADSEAVSDPDAAVKRKHSKNAAVIAIATLSTNSASLVPDLLALLEKRDWDGRRSVATALGYTGTTNEAVFPVVERDMASSSSATRIDALIILAGLPSSGRVIDLIIKGASDGNEKVRASALSALARHKANERASAALNDIAKGAPAALNDIAEKQRFEQEMVIQFMAKWALRGTNIPPSTPGNGLNLVE